MKFIRKFNEESEKSIEEWCKEFNIHSYQINSDNSVNPFHTTYVCGKPYLESLPIKFGTSRGGFCCWNNNLKTLKGSPTKVNGSFDCHNNKLETLEYCTKEISGDFNCSQNNLTSLEHGPTKVGYSYNCSHNYLSSLKGCLKIIINDFTCDNNKLTMLEGGPEIVNGHYSCETNYLISLEGGPKEIGGSINIYCYGNPIYNVYELFGDYKEYKDSLDYNYLRGDCIIKHRLQEALEEIGENAPNYIEGYKYI